MKNTTKSLIAIAILVAGYVTPLVSFAQYYYPLQVSCRANTAQAMVNTSLGWSASGVGGNGVYTYSWSGSDDLSGTGNSVSQTYSTQGIKTASITVISNGQTATANCGTVYVYPTNYYNNNYNYGNLSGSCSTNISNPSVGDNVNWSAYAVGGSGAYTYSWTDFEGYNGTGQYLSRFYTIPGAKNMTLTISSGGQTITRYCNVYVMGTAINNPVYNPYIPPVYNPTIPTTPIQNQVLGYNSSGTTLAAVYLSDVPYTGLEDVLVPILFMLAVLSWSMLLAYRFTKNSHFSR